MAQLGRRCWPIALAVLGDRKRRWCAKSPRGFEECVAGSLSNWRRYWRGKAKGEIVVDYRPPGRAGNRSEQEVKRACAEALVRCPLEAAGEVARATHRPQALLRSANRWKADERHLKREGCREARRQAKRPQPRFLAERLAEFGERVRTSERRRSIWSRSGRIVGFARVKRAQAVKISQTSIDLETSQRVAIAGGLPLPDLHKGEETRAST